MINSSINIYLSHHEVLYICKSIPLTIIQRELICGNVQNYQSIRLSLSSSAAEELRELFTEKLAIAGFDDKYEPTPEGQLLEELIGNR